MVDRLKRSSTDCLIAGVCGGIAEHFGWDPTLVRIAFILSGVGLLPYLILMIVMPDH